jgi:hypothetical protein
MLLLLAGCCCMRACVLHGAEWTVPALPVPYGMSIRPARQWLTEMGLANEHPYAAWGTYRNVPLGVRSCRVSRHTHTHPLRLLLLTHQAAKRDGCVMKTSSESPAIPTNAHLLQFTPHAKQDSSQSPTPPKLELQVKHEAEEVPSFRASPSSSGSPSHKEWRLTTPVSHETHLQIGPVYWPPSLDTSQHPCVDTIHGSSVGMATTSTPICGRPLEHWP